MAFHLECKDLLRPEVIRSIKDGDIVLEEKKVMKVAVHGMSSEAVILCLMGINHLPFFKVETNLNKICDYLVIDTLDGKCYAIFIELKKTLTGSRFKEQLRRSRPLLDYLIGVHNVEYEESDPCRPEIRYCVIGEKYAASLDKQRVRENSAPIQRHSYKYITIHQFLGSRVGIGANIDAKNILDR